MLWIILNNIGWTSTSSVLLVLAFGAWITGGLHIDGLIDTADGLAAGKEKSLFAMRDSRIGAGGIQMLLVILLIQISALIKLGEFTPIVLLLSSYLGRISPLIAINNFQYLYTEGTGMFHKANWKGIKEESLPSLAILTITIAIVILVNISFYIKIKIFISIIFGIFFAILVPYLLGEKIGGHSGDTYGASIVITETIFLLLSSFIF